MKNAVKVKPNYKNNMNHTVVETNKEMLMCMMYECYLYFCI